MCKTTVQKVSATYRILEKGSSDNVIRVIYDSYSLSHAETTYTPGFQIGD